MGFKIYTKTGDQGQTALFGGRRVLKSDLRIDAYGTVDELNANLGLLRDLCADQPVREQLKTIQDRLFTLGANLAADPQKELPRPDLYPADVEILESEMDRMDATLPELRNFILPGGHPTVSQCHVARCVCRRAERLTVALAQAEPVDPIVIQYLNRLSDYLFILGRRLAADLGVEEVVWKPRG
jgi:cob(I)alamin adenosyltransferase